MKFDGKKPVNPHIFAELKRLAIELWRTYDDTYWYATEKVGRIINLTNSHDNFVRFSQCLTISIKQKYTNKPVLGFAIRFVVVLAI